MISWLYSLMFWASSRMHLETPFSFAQSSYGYLPDQVAGPHPRHHDRAYACDLSSCPCHPSSPYYCPAPSRCRHRRPRKRSRNRLQKRTRRRREFCGICNTLCTSISALGISRHSGIYAGAVSASQSQKVYYVPFDVFLPIPSLSITSSAHLILRSSSGSPLNRSVAGWTAVVGMGCW